VIFTHDSGVSLEGFPFDSTANLQESGSISSLIPHQLSHQPQQPSSGQQYGRPPVTFQQGVVSSHSAISEQVLWNVIPTTCSLQTHSLVSPSHSSYAHIPQPQQYYPHPPIEHLSASPSRQQHANIPTMAYPHHDMQNVSIPACMPVVNQR